MGGGVDDTGVKGDCNATGVTRLSRAVAGERLGDDKGEEEDEEELLLSGVEKRNMT
jgi:hypothetical protein